MIVEHKITVPFVKLISRAQPDRLGANIFSYISQISFCHKLNYYIEFDELRYNNSIFIKSIKDYIIFYNSNKIKSYEVTISDITKSLININDVVALGFIVNNIIFCDIFSYFKEKIFYNFNKLLLKNAFNANYKLLFDPIKTILIHLRLDDLNENNSIDYNGELVHNFFSKKMNNNYFVSPINDNTLSLDYYKYVTSTEYVTPDNYSLSNNINGKRNTLKNFGNQSIIEEYKILTITKELEKKYPEHKIIIISSPIGNIKLPYCNIRTNDTSFDLFCLCNCDKLILSRSTYALSSIFFSNASEIWVPNWSLSVLSGLNTKYDNNRFHFYN